MGTKTLIKSVRDGDELRIKMALSVYETVLRTSGKPDDIAKADQVADLRRRWNLS